MGLTKSIPSRLKTNISEPASPIWRWRGSMIQAAFWISRTKIKPRKPSINTLSKKWTLKLSLQPPTKSPSTPETLILLKAGDLRCPSNTTKWAGSIYGSAMLLTWTRNRKLRVVESHDFIDMNVSTKRSSKGTITREITLGEISKRLQRREENLTISQIASLARSTQKRKSKRRKRRLKKIKNKKKFKKKIKKW